MKTALIIGDSHVDGAGLGGPLKKELEALGYQVTQAGVGATAAQTWLANTVVCRPKKDKCVDQAKLPHGVDLLVVSLGTNDAANASAAGGDKAKQAAANVQKIVQLRDNYAPKAWFWVGPPWMGDSMKHYTNENMEFIYNAAKQAGVEVFDSREATKPLRDTPGNMDAVHFYGAKGAVWAKAVAKAIGSSAPTTTTDQPPADKPQTAGIGLYVVAALVLFAIWRSRR